MIKRDHVKVKHFKRRSSKLLCRNGRKNKWGVSSSKKKSTRRKGRACLDIIVSSKTGKGGSRSV